MSFFFESSYHRLPVIRSDVGPNPEEAWRHFRYAAEVLGRAAATVAIEGLRDPSANSAVYAAVVVFDYSLPGNTDVVIEKDGPEYLFGREVKPRPLPGRSLVALIFTANPPKVALWHLDTPPNDLLSKRPKLREAIDVAMGSDEVSF